MAKNNVEFIITGESYYSSLAQPNSKGKFASNCYEVGIENPSVNFSKNTDEKSRKHALAVFETYIKDITSETGDVIGQSVKIKNSKYPIPTFDNEGNRIDLPRISNGTKLIVKVKTAYSDNYSKDYLTVMAVKLIDEYKPFNPFGDIDDYEF